MARSHNSLSNHPQNADSNGANGATSAQTQDRRFTGYPVRLPVFEGPLDLLLYLIEREELDITTVSLAAVTDQFLAYMSELEKLEPGALSDFMVVAARLLFIKSRTLLPAPASPDDDEEEDPGEALVRQLQEYRRFKEVAARLGDRDSAGLRAYVRVAPLPPLERKLDLGNLTAQDLRKAVRRALTRRPLPPTPPRVRQPRFTVRDQIERIRCSLRSDGQVAFSQLLDATATRVEVVVTLMAVLELARQEEVAVEQDGLFAEIWVRSARQHQVERT